MPPLAHDECKKEYDRLHEAGLCVFCGLAVGKERAEGGGVWHHECSIREDFSGY